MTPEIEQAVSIELQFALKPNWTLAKTADHFEVAVPADAQGQLSATAIDEIWRITRFVAYPSFVSIERPDARTAVMTSRQATGDGFQIVFVAR